MGFRSVSYNIEKMAESLGTNKEAVVKAMKDARQGGFARLFKFEDKGKFGSGQIATSTRKDRESPWETDFQDGFVAFVGEAYAKAKRMDIPKSGVPIIILNCEVRVRKGNNDKMFTNYTIFDFDTYNSGGTSGETASKPKSAPKQAEEDDDNELPF